MPTALPLNRGLQGIQRKGSAVAGRNQRGQERLVVYANQRETVPDLIRIE